MVNQDNGQPQTAANGFTWPICQGIDCSVQLELKRPNQKFCSPECKKKFLGVAYRLGISMLTSLERIKKELSGHHPIS